MRRKKQLRLGSVLAAVLVAASAAFAFAQGGDPTTQVEPDTPEAAEAQAICGGPPPCVTVNGFAYDAAAESGGESIMRFDEAIAEHGKPASSCPEAARAYEKAGVDVDAFIGPCPPPDAAPSGEEAQGLGSDPPPTAGAK